MVPQFGSPLVWDRICSVISVLAFVLEIGIGWGFLSVLMLLICANLFVLDCYGLERSLAHRGMDLHYNKYLSIQETS